MSSVIYDDFNFGNCETDQHDASPLCYKEALKNFTSHEIEKKVSLTRKLWECLQTRLLWSPRTVLRRVTARLAAARVPTRIHLLLLVVHCLLLK